MTLSQTPSQSLSNNAQIWAVVPAAGVGSRMQADKPKQYLMLGEKTVLSHTLQALLSHPRIAGVVLALGEKDPYWPELAEAQDPRIKTVLGGAERADSVLAALAAVPSDWALVHDAARPCVQHKDISALIATCEACSDGAILAMPVRDTLKRVGSENAIADTVDRSNIWHALTPQLFDTRALQQAITQAEQAGVAVTDEASAMEWAGFNPKVVPGAADNIKITHPDDLRLAALYLDAYRATHKKTNNSQESK